jgi:outer membrane protein assembly factor BamB
MKKLIVLIMASLMMSCEKPEPLPVTPVQDSQDQLQVVWYRWLSGKPDTISRFSLKPLIYKNQVITTDYNLLSYELEVISSFNKLNGCLNWRWDDYYNRGRGNSGYYFGGVKYNSAGALYWCGVRSYYSIDLNTGKSIRRFDTEASSCLSGQQYPRFDENKGLILNSFAFPYTPYPDECIQFVFDSEFRIISKISFLKEGGWHPNIGQPKSYFVGDDTLIICPVNWLHRDSARVEKSGVYCYSMKQDTMIWSIKGIERDISINPAISSGKYYSVAGSDFYCLDILTGRLVWKRSLNLPLAYRFVDPVTIADGKIFARNSIGDTYCLNATNGLVIWANTLNAETGASGFAEGAKIEYYKGRLYYSDSMMYVLDAVSGRLIKKYKVPKSVPQYAENYIQGITIDPETDLMYFTDGYHLICARMPE